MQRRIILEPRQFSLTLDRLCHQLIENHRDFSNSCLIGVQPRGVLLADRIIQRLEILAPKANLLHGQLDITFYRDDFRMHDTALKPSNTNIPFTVEGKRVILIDDVLYTGRTIRSAMDALLDMGRAEDVELLVLIDRRLHRHLPIQAKYIGHSIDSINSEKVIVEWGKKPDQDKVWIIPDEVKTT